MATLFDTIEDVLSGSSISTALGAQAGSLGGIISTVEGLITNPPDSFGNFVTAIAEAAPALDITGGLSGPLGALTSAMPADISGVLAPLTSALDKVEDATGLNLSTGIGEILEAIQAITRLLEMDFTFGIRLHPTQAAANSTSGASASGSAATPATPGSGAVSGPATPAPPPGLVKATAGTARAKAMLDTLPSPLTLPALLTWILGQISPTRPGFLHALPVLDELRDPLGALMRWDALGASAILDEFSATLGAASSLIQARMQAALHTPLADLGALSAQFDGETLASLASDMTTALAAIKTAVDSGSLAGTTATINSLGIALDSYDALRASFAANAQTPLTALTKQIGTLPEVLDETLSYVCTVLGPSGSLADLAGETPAPGLPESAGALFTEIENRLNTYLGYFTHLLDVLDVSVIQDPLQAVADGAGTALDAVDSALTMLGSCVQDIFAGLEDALAAVDPSALSAPVTSAITDFKNSLSAKISEAFAPVRAALSQVVDTIGTAVDAFDPAAIKAGLEKVLTDLTGVFTEGDIASALRTVRDALETAAAQVEQLAFTPVIDEVCTGIGSVKDALAAIDPEQLNTALKLALAGAMAILPSELTPVTGPLVSGFGELIEQGPVPLLDGVKDLPAELFDKIRAFEPQTLIGDALSKPFQELTGKMEAFKPSKLLDTVSEGFDTFKERLKQNAGPEAAFSPLYTLQKELADNFAKIHPDELLRPVEDQIQQVMQRVRASLPVDEVFSVLDEIIGQVQGVAGLGDGVIALTSRVNEILGVFTSGQDQLQSWVDGILAKISGDMGGVNSAAAALATAIDTTKAASLTSAFQTATAALITQLETINPAGRLSAVYNASHAIAQNKIDALPASSAKTLLISTLARIEDTAFKSVFVALADIRQALLDARSGLETRLQTWDARYHATGTILSSLYTRGTISIEALRGWIRDDIMHHLGRPLSFLFAFTKAAGRMLQAFTNALTNVLTDIKAKITALVQGPGSLGAVRDAIQALVDRITHINLAFLTSSLNAAHASVKTKIDGVKTALENLQQSITQAFEGMLDTLSLASIIPADSLASLDADYTAILTKLKGLDPDKLVTEALQQTYEQTVLPIVESFDFSPVIQSLVDKLKSLEAELSPDMERVNTSYQEMLAAAPDVSVGLSDIGDALGF